VRMTIDLNDQRLLRAEEIHNAIADDVLASEFVTTDLRSTETPPKLCLEWSHLTAETFCSNEKMSVLHASLPHPLPLP
jgi:hypothetical protein